MAIKLCIEMIKVLIVEDDMKYSKTVNFNIFTLNDFIYLPVNYIVFLLFFIEYVKYKLILKKEILCF